MAYALATRLERAAKNAGVKYKKVSGWGSRGHGTMGTIRSVICHHTAGPKSGNSPSLNVVAYGRPGLSGPLAQLFLARDGTVYLVAAGISYHAGKVSSSNYQNSHSIGIEAEATGLDSWPSGQIDAYAKLCKALIKEFKLPVSRVVGHKEAAVPRGRKPDPNFSMPDFRKKVGGAKGGVSSGGGSAGGGSSNPTYKQIYKGALLRTYVKGTPVKDVQKQLGLKADGYYGDATKSGVVKFQKSKGLGADGIVGDATWAALKKAGMKPSPSDKPTKPRAAAFPLPKGHWYGPESKNSKNHSGFYAKDRPGIKQIQKKLGVGVDGKYGPKTYATVSAYQRRSKLSVDGAVGAKTWGKLFS